MSNVARLAPVRAAGLAVLLLCGSQAARSADLPFDGMGALPPPALAPSSERDGGGYYAPRWPVRPAPNRFDIYGYPLLGPGLVGRPAPLALGVGCPPALEPAYDPDGNLAGYAPLQYCR